MRERGNRLSVAYPPLADMLYLEALDLHLLPFAISGEGGNAQLHRALGARRVTFGGRGAEISPDEHDLVFYTW